MRQQYLLLEDVDDIGRSGEVISVKPGFARNYLIPQKKAVLATGHTLRMQERLQTERAKQAESERLQSEALAAQLEGKVLRIEVKVDPEGNMYGSVGAVEIAHLFEQEGVRLERRNVGTHLHLKQLGAHNLVLKLKEGVTCNYTVIVEAEQSLHS